MSNTYRLKHSRGRVLPVNDVARWNNFSFTPQDGGRPFYFHVSAGCAAFLLNGIINRMPDLLATAETLEGDPCVRVELEPPMSSEFEFPNSIGNAFCLSGAYITTAEHAMKADVVKRLLPRIEQRPAAPQTCEPQMLRCEKGPEAVENRHPVYGFVGCLTD